MWPVDPAENTRIPSDRLSSLSVCDNTKFNQYDQCRKYHYPPIDLQITGGSLTDNDILPDTRIIEVIRLIHMVVRIDIDLYPVEIIFRYIEIRYIEPQPG